MSLSKWENYVKNNKIISYYETDTAPHFVDCLEADCNEAFDYINGKVDLAIDHSETATSMRLQNADAVQHRYNVAFKESLNKHIQYALDAIEDIEAEKSEQCDIEAFKYERASNE